VRRDEGRDRARGAREDLHDRDPSLVEKYGRSVPVLEIAGRAAFKGRGTAEEIARKVERALREREPA
jgi:hypothetical protein